MNKPTDFKINLAQIRLDVFSRGQGLGPFEDNLSVDIRLISPIALAYIGDAVYELYVRTHFLWPPQRINSYHQSVVAQVKAEQQALYLAQITPQLNEAEQNIVRRGRNASPKRHRRVSPDVYQQATGFETLMGYLYLVDGARLFELLQGLQLE